MVETRLASFEKGLAIFQAEIHLPEGGKATGWGARRDLSNETDGSSTDPHLGFITEAENQALARALAILGYGMEYAQDFDLPAEAEAIPLRDNGENTAEEEASIEVPLNPVPVREATPEPSRVRGEVIFPEKLTPEPEEETPEEEEEEDREERNAPTPLRAIHEEPARLNPEPTPLRPNRGSSTVTTQPTSMTARRLTPTPIEPPTPIPVTTASSLSNPAIEERLKGITDSRLVLAIKQIFNEARRLHNLNEDAVDRSSQKRYGVPVSGLNTEQADQYLEIIKNANRTPKKR